MVMTMRRAPRFRAKVVTNSNSPVTNVIEGTYLPEALMVACHGTPFPEITPA
jgi:hypothetical protein